MSNANVGLINGLSPAPLRAPEFPCVFILCDPFHAQDASQIHTQNGARDIKVLFVKLSHFLCEKMSHKV